MHRAHFLSSLLALPFVSALALTRRPTLPSPTPGNFCASLEPMDWLRRPRLPVWEGQGDAAFILRAIQQEREIQFRYLGGSRSGQRRRVSPDLLFRVQPDGPLYFSAYCHERGAMRVFRLDRVVAWEPALV